MSLGWSTQQIWLRMRRNKQYQPIWFLFDCNQSSTLWVIYFRQCQIYGGSVWCREDCGEIHPTTFLCFTCMPDFSGRSNWTIRQIAGLLLLADRSQKLQPNMLLIQGADFFLIDLNLGLRNKTSQWRRERVMMWDMRDIGLCLPERTVVI